MSIATYNDPRDLARDIAEAIAAGIDQITDDDLGPKLAERTRSAFLELLTEVVAARIGIIALQRSTLDARDFVSGAAPASGEIDRLIARARREAIGQLMTADEEAHR